MKSESKFGVSKDVSGEVIIGEALLERMWSALKKEVHRR